MSVFPSLVIRADGFEPRGSFAEAQAEFLEPDARSVDALDTVLRERQIGVVAHFYMDAELQGVLTACTWPHIHISDSLVMADRAVRMAEAGVRAIVVLGVDFMSENVRAVMDAAGFSDIPVYRVAAEPIGCSLAESAESAAYGAWLEAASKRDNALHVVYINTSLLTKARAQATVPTITCTSSNVVQTILQAAAQVPELEVFYGPDTYMGGNLEAMFERYGQLDDEAIKAIHPAHDRRSIAALLDRFQYFRQGTCIVHHMFGSDVVEQVRAHHMDSYLTAHLEVPGEMFALAAEAAQEDRGVVGSTSNILGFILERVEEALAGDGPARPSFVLGTEAGMITAIVDQVRARLREAGRDDVEVEILFPVSTEAIAQAPESPLGVVPGAASGEGCSVGGGCATCPFMKMNELDALLDVCQAFGTSAQQELAGFVPRTYTEHVAGRTAADIGCEPILSMRHFQRTGELPGTLIDQVRQRPVK